MINMYQAGGATQGSILQEIAKLPQEQQKQIMAAFGKWAQSKGLNIQQLQGRQKTQSQHKPVPYQILTNQQISTELSKLVMSSCYPHVRLALV